MTTTTTNMNLVLPDVSSTVGPTWATLLNAAYTSIDSHDHSTGKGVAITPSGLNISSDLSFAQNNATNLRSARLYNNSSFSAGVNDLTCLYALNNELYYKDGAGNVVQVTSGGTLNLAGGVSSLTINDSQFLLQYFGDTSRKFRFSAASIPSSTTRIYTLPDSGSNDTIVTQAATQTLTNKTLTSAIITGSTAVNLISGSGTLTLPTSGTVTIPNGTDTVVTLTGSQTLTNKILTGNTIASFTPNGGTNTLTAPAITDTLVTRTNSETLTNKTLTGAIITDYEEFTNTTAPATPSSGKLRVYSKSDNKLYKKDSSGVEVQVGSGTSSSINYISNPDFEDGTVTGWATYADAAASTPADGTGGSPSSTFAINSSSPLRGTYDAVWTKSAANRQGEGFSYNFTLAAADVSKTLQITFDSKASANFVSGDMTIYVYDVTNATLITPSSINVPTGTSSQYSLAFQATTSTSYRLIFHTATTNASAYTLEIDQISVSPVVRPMVAGESDWISYTPTFSAGFGTVTNAAGKWKRVGDSIIITGSCTTGTVAASVCTISLPGSYTIDSSKITLSNTSANFGQIIGTCGNNTNSATSNIVTATGTSTSAVYLAGEIGTQSPGVPANGTAILASSSTTSFWFQVPITQWSSNITLASTTPMIEYVYNTSATDANDTSSFGYGAGGIAGVIGTTALTSNRAKRVRFQNAIQPTDRVVVELSSSNNRWFPVATGDQSVGFTSYQSQNGVTYGLGLGMATVSSTDIDVLFGRYVYPSGATYGAAGLAWNDASTSGYKWRVAKYSAIGAAELAPATNTSSGTITRENTWTAYTPTISAGFGTVTNNSAFYKVLGDSLFIRGSFTTGTVAGSLGTISIPSGFTISSSKLSLSNTSANPGNMVGSMSQAATAQQNTWIVTATGTSTSVVYSCNSFANASGYITPTNVNAAFTNTLNISYQFEVPIV